MTSESAHGSPCELSFSFTYFTRSDFDIGARVSSLKKSYIGFAFGERLPSPFCVVTTFVGFSAIPAALRRSLILKSAMEEFKHKLISLGLFSTVLRNVPLEGNNEIDIPYIPLATSTSKDFDGTYKFDKGDMESRKITIDRRKYQSLTYTSEEKARQPYFDPITLGRLKGSKLAEDVLLDILSVITAQNFGDAILTRNAADFDTDDIIDLETKIDELEWPDSPRGMLLKSSYMRQNIDYVKRTIDSAVNVAVMDANGNLATLKVLQHIDGGNIMTDIYYFDPSTNMMSKTQVFSTGSRQVDTGWKPTNIQFVLPTGESAEITILADQNTLNNLGTAFYSEPCEVCDGGTSTVKYFLVKSGEGSE